MKTLRFLILVPFLSVLAVAADNTYAAEAVPVAPPAPAPLVASPAVQAAQTDPAVVEVVLKAMHYDEQMDKALSQQKQMIRQMFLRMPLPHMTKEESTAFEEKTINAAWTGLNSVEVHAVIARDYAETFTTDELRAIADFYKSPAGQAFLTKQGLVQQKIVAELKPRLVQAMRKVQQLTREFSMEQQAKAAKAAADAAAQVKAAAPAPVSAPTPAATPKP
jgi:hypothetical protein